MRKQILRTLSCFFVLAGFATVSEGIETVQPAALVAEQAKAQQQADGQAKGESLQAKGEAWERALSELVIFVDQDREEAVKRLDSFVVALVDGLSGRFDVARDEFSKILASDKSHVCEPFWRVAGDAANRKVRPEAARRLFLGGTLQYMGELRAAVGQYDKAVQEDPQYPVSYDIRGFAHMVNKDRDRGIADYTKALKLDPGDVTAYNRRGVAYYTIEEYDKATKDYNNALAHDPSYIKALTNRGNVYHQQGKDDLAIADYDKALAIYPRFAAAYFDRGLSRMAMIGRPIGGVSRPASTVSSKDKVPRESAMKYEEAIADFDQALSIDPAYVDAYIARETPTAPAANRMRPWPITKMP